MESPRHLEIRGVTPNGCMRFQSQEWFLGRVLQGQKVALEEIEDGIRSVCFGPILLGRNDKHQQRVHRTEVASVLAPTACSEAVSM